MAMPYPQPSTTAAASASGTVSADAATAATPIPTRTTTSDTTTARALRGVSILRPSAWIANPAPRPTMHMSAENASGSPPVFPDISDGRTA